ncbi:transcription initiation factor TFIID subunit 4-like [Asterias rubens]|uniref:transcription initiation factor TFIID subunit 4-like n=1 Tax=Asterias rubens TaxID=7604 RepID=UPI0014559E4E|nr:transcription initiation factor TFIID subunit 4-like [Asterias rubens]
MAGTTSIEDILSSVVDETAVSALIGSLESKLAAGNAASTPGTIDNSSVGSNHVSEPAVSSGDVKPTQPNTTQINAVRDGPMASTATPGPNVVSTAGASNVTNAGGSSTDAMVHATTTASTNSKAGHEQKSGATIIVNKGSNGAVLNMSSSIAASSSSKTNSTSSVGLNTPTTCVRIITLPTSMGGTVLATDTAASVSAMHNQTVKNTVLSNARTVVKTVGGVLKQGDQNVVGQGVLNQTGTAMTTVTGSVLSTGSSPSTEINRQSTTQNTSNLTVREHLTSGAKHIIGTSTVPSPTTHPLQTSTNVNLTTSQPQIVLRPAPSLQVQTSTNLNKPNASSSSVVTLATTSISGVRTQSGVISGHTHVTPQMHQVRLASPQVIAPRAPGGTVQFRLPQGTSLPPGVMLINKDGNIHAVVNSSIASGGQIQQLPTGTVPGAVTYRQVQPGSPALQRPGSQPTSIVQPNMRQNIGQVLNTSNTSMGQLKTGTQMMVGGSPVTFISKSATRGSPSLGMTGQGVRSNTPTMVAVSSGGIMSVTMAGVQRTITTPPVGGPALIVGAQPQPIPMSQSAMENVKKCRNFLTTLIKLASNGNQPAETVKNVKELVQNLIDGKTEPEEFTLKLQKELKSSPQPYLIPFLKKSLPLLRQTLQKGGSLQIQGLSAPTITAAQTGDSFTHSNTLSGIAASQPTLVSTLATGPGGKTTTLNLTAEQLQQLSQQHHAAKQKSKLASLQPQSQKSKAVIASTASKSSPTTHSSSSRSSQSSKSHSSKSSASKSSSSSSSSSSKKDKVKDHAASGFKEDDDINDVTSMAGVNLSEESARILATNADFIGTQLRSIKEEKFLFTGPLQSKVNEICVKHGIQEASSDMMELISHAAQDRLKDLVEKLGVIAMHRMEVYRNDSRYEVTSDVRSQLKFFEQLDSLERKRRDEQERELLLRAAKSRSKQEDPEQLRLKQKAKEMQQMELEQIRQQEANMTALAAIGPRKKRKLDSPTPGSSSGAGSSFSTGSSSGNPSARSQMRRIKRVNFRDLIFLMEQEQEMKKSQFFFRMFLK